MFLSSSSAVAEVESAVAERVEREEESAVAEATRIRGGEEIRVAEMGDYYSKHKTRIERRGMQYSSTQMKVVRPFQRRRARGGGRHHSAAVIREMLIDWYSKLRHSVNIKLMCRLPMKVLLVKAQMLQQDYVVSCLKAGCQPERVDINGRWLRHFCHEYRLAVRQPNRKFKVPRWVLAERLDFFWLSVAKVRKFISLAFGYDPRCRNIDQSPFHANEAGSKCLGRTRGGGVAGRPTTPLFVQTTPL